jgi:single-strand DNA-binding protein
VINKVFVMGPIKNDPVVKPTEKGTLFGKFVVEAKDNVDKNSQWLHVHAFGKVADAVQPLRKDDVVIVEGKMETKKHNDPKTGESKYFTYVSANKIVKFAATQSFSSSQESDDIPF